MGRKDPKSTQASENPQELSPVKRALQEIRDLRAQLAEAEEAAFARNSGPIAIIGMGLRFPGGVFDAESFWQLLSEGRDVITEIPQDRWDWRQYFDANPDAQGSMYSARGGILDGIDLFDADFFGIAPREAVMLDPQQRLLHEVAWHALEDAAVRPDRLRDSNTGVFLGLSNFDYYRAALEDDQRIDAYVGSGNSPSMAAGRLAYTLGLHGPAMTIDTSCSSSLVAVHLASQSLRAGECDVALAGGVNVILAPQMHIGFSRARMLSPDGHCKTFDQAADGYVRSEGCAVVVLKRLPDAIRNGDCIRAVIRASATNHDGRSGGLTAPSSQAQASLLREVLSKSGVSVDQVGMIEAHGTGTSLGDPIEMEALREVFLGRSPQLSPIVVGSVKTNLGHMEAASGMAGLLKAVLALQHCEIPRHLHLNHPSSYIPWKQLPFEVPTTLRAWNLDQGQSRRVAGVSSFGFSGSNAHVLLEEYRARSTEKALVRVNIPQVAVLSARIPEAIHAIQGNLVGHLHRHQEVDLEDICQTLARGRSHHSYRRAFVVNTREELICALESQQSCLAISTTEDNSLCSLFTGQGSEHSGMGLDLMQRSHVFRDAIERLEEALDGLLGKSIPTIWANRDGEVERACLVQPSLFAYGWGLSEVWKSWGVVPRVVLGHSLGEYVAATVAGVMTPEQGIRLVAARGRLTEQLAEPGAMVAIVADASEIEQLFAHMAVGAELSIAAINGPRSVVVSGRLHAIAELEGQLREAQLRHKRLSTTHGFHSAALDPMLDAFEDEASGIQFRIPEIAWISNLTGNLIDRTQPVNAQYWRRHLRDTVHFSKGLQTAKTTGVVRYLEMGPEPQLLALAEANGIASDRCIASIAKSGAGGEWSKFLRSASVLFERGIDLDWDAVSGNLPYRKVSLPGYTFQRKHYWFNDGAPVEKAPSRQMAEAAKEQAGMVPIALRVDRMSERQAAFNDWAIALMAFTLRELGCFGIEASALTSQDLLEKHSVSSNHQHLMERWLRRLADENVLELVAGEGNGLYKLSSAPAVKEPAEIWTEEQHLLADDSPLRDYLSNCAKLLLPVLRGEVNALETLFPAGDGELAKALYERSPGSAYANRIAAAAVAARARMMARTALGFPRRLRILEIGAGTGATTSAILPQLPRESLLYTFSDLSEVFLSRARIRFQEHPMEFVLFDLDRDGHAFAHQSRYDVVVIANALHAARDLRLSLSRVFKLLQPGGSLVLVETTTEQAWHDVSTGLIEGWQHFTDNARSNGSPLLSIDQWASELGYAGFEGITHEPGQEQVTQCLGLHVLLAHKPSRPLQQPNSPNVHQTDYGSPGPAIPAFITSQVQASFVPSPLISTGLAEEIAAASPRQQVALALAAVAHSVSQTLGRAVLPKKTDRLMDIGLDSLMALELRNRLQGQFGIEQLPATLIFDSPTCEAIARFLLECLGHKQDGQQDVETYDRSESLHPDPVVHTEVELDAMSDEQVAELLRMQLGH